MLCYICWNIEVESVIEGSELLLRGFTAPDERAVWALPWEMDGASIRKRSCSFFALNTAGRPPVGPARPAFKGGAAHQRNEIK